MGLYHADTFTNDPFPNYESRGKSIARNFMLKGRPSRVSSEFPLGVSFSESQKKAVHSYLGKGRVYKQLERVGFDLNRYEAIVGAANGFKR